MQRCKVRPIAAKPTTFYIHGEFSGCAFRKCTVSIYVLSREESSYFSDIIILSWNSSNGISEDPTNVINEGVLVLGQT